MRNKNETVDAFKTWLETFPTGSPSLKVNGSGYTTAVIAVDFGSPKDSIKLTPEQSSDLHNRMKDATTALTGRRNVRVQFDHNNGMHWTSI